MSRALRFAVVAVLAGCSFRPVGAALGDAEVPDATGDDAMLEGDAPDAGPCIAWDALNVVPCDASFGAPGGVYDLGESMEIERALDANIGASVTTMHDAAASQLASRVANASIRRLDEQVGCERA